MGNCYVVMGQCSAIECQILGKEDSLNNAKKQIWGPVQQLLSCYLETYSSRCADIETEIKFQVVRSETVFKPEASCKLHKA